MTPVRQPTIKEKLTDLGLTSPSFSDGESLGRRVIINVEGRNKVGKDHFAFHAPDPIVVFNFDQGLEYVIEKFRRGDGVPKKRIIVAGMPLQKGRSGYPTYAFARPVPDGGMSRRSDAYLDRVKKLAYPIWEKFIADYNEALRSNVRSLIIDTGGAAFALAKFAFIGMSIVKPKDDPYGAKSGDMKSIFQGLVTDGYSYDKNVIWLHRVKENWSNGEPDGTFKTDGYNQMGYEVQFTVRLNKKVIKGKDEFSATVRDCRIDPAMNGEVFAGRQCRFSTVMAAVTGSEEEAWE